MKKKGIARKRRISTEEKYEVYKYYFPDLPKKSVWELIEVGIIEKIVLQYRWADKARLNEAETIFKRHIMGSRYIDLAKAYRCSTSKITKIVNEVRLNLIYEIQADISFGLFVNKPSEYEKSAPKITDAQALEDWKEFCAGISPKMVSKIKFQDYPEPIGTKPKLSTIKAWQKFRDKVINMKIPPQDSK
jgi:hypothetical protein